MEHLFYRLQSDQPVAFWPELSNCTGSRSGCQKHKRLEFRHPRILQAGIGDPASNSFLYLGGQDASEIAVGMNYQQTPRFYLCPEPLSGFSKCCTERLKGKPSAQTLFNPGAHKGVDVLSFAVVLNVAYKNSGSSLPLYPAARREVLVRGTDCIWMQL
jgi:hypothetical protein